MINDISQKFLNNHECELHKLDLGHGNISFVYHNKYHESKSIILADVQPKDQLKQD